MKHIVWARINSRLIHDQVMTQWVQYTEADGVLVIDDDIVKDSFPQMVMKSSAPGKIGLKVLSIRDAIGYLNEDGKHEKIIILVKTPAVLDELSDVGVHLKSINAGGIGTRAGREPMFKNISVSKEEKEVFHDLLNKGINMFLRVIVTGPEEDIAKRLQKRNGMPMRIRSSQVVYRR